MESSPQTSSCSSCSISSNGEGGDNDELGKQIVDLIKRLINEADPEKEKIKIEFTFTPFKEASTKTKDGKPKHVNPPMSQIVTTYIDLSSQQKTKSTASKDAHRHGRQEKLSSKERKPKISGSPTRTTSSKVSSLISSASSKYETASSSTPSSSAPKKGSSAISNLSYSNYYQNLLQIVDKQRSETSSVPSFKKASSKTKSKKRR